MNPFRRGYNRIIYLTGIALLLITLGIEYSQYKRHQDFLLNDLKNRLDEHTSNVNLRARTLQGYVHGLKMAAQNSLFYIQNFGITSPLFSYLKNEFDGNAYFLNIKDPKINVTMVGHLIGLGSLEKASPSLKAELNMALMLNTFFEVALRNNRGVVWAYYISKNKFQNLYPWIPSDQPPTFESLKNTLFFKGITPQKNPKRLNFWTPAYWDGTAYENQYQKGLIVTNSSPVYDGEEFLGSVSLDLSLTELNRVINNFDAAQGSLFLINKEHQVLAANRSDPPPLNTQEVPSLEQFVTSDVVQKIDQEIKAPSGWFIPDKSRLIYVKDLHEAPWFMIYVGSKSVLFMPAFLEALEDIFIIMLALMFVVGMGYLLVIRDFISPAQKLVDHISEENRGVKSSPQNLPSRWRPWFHIVSRIFAENRALLADLENRVKKRTQQLQKKNLQLEKTLMDLKKAQNQIIVQEKLASLGSLTAGIAHEIKNPLNFIINFSELSLEHLHELREKAPNEVELFDLIEQDITKAQEHAERADSIVKSMLSHARGSTGERTTFNLNKLVEESMDLAYIGFQGKKHNFTAKIIKKLDPKIEDIQGSKQDLARVFLNIVNNACFAMHEKRERLGDTYQPELIVTTKDKGKNVEIIFEDNGPGMGQAVMRKIFTPFFTTKDASRGTGLGLSLSYDIITHQHHGHIRVESKLKRYSRFIINLPRKG